MKISAERARELGKGGALKNTQGKRYIPRTPRPEAVSPIKNEQPTHDNSLKESIESITKTIVVSGEALAGIVKNNQVMADVIAEIIKPEPKKKWSVTVVSRGQDGLIESLSIEEV